MTMSSFINAGKRDAYRDNASALCLKKYGIKLHSIHMWPMEPVDKQGILQQICDLAHDDYPIDGKNVGLWESTKDGGFSSNIDYLAAKAEPAYKEETGEKDNNSRIRLEMVSLEEYVKQVVFLWMQEASDVYQDYWVDITMTDDGRVEHLFFTALIKPKEVNTNESNV